MQRFHFNTGVRPFDHNPPAGMAFMPGFVDSGNGVYVIPFEVDDVPKGSILKCACDIPDLPGHEDCIVREIYNCPIMLSKYAYFIPPVNYNTHGS